MQRSQLVVSGLLALILLSSCSNSSSTSSQPDPVSQSRSRANEHQETRGREGSNVQELSTGLRVLTKAMEENIGVRIVFPPVAMKRLRIRESELFVGEPAPEASLVWRWKNGRHLRAGYGSTSLMNCGGGPPHLVDIGGETGLAVKKRRSAAVIWPTSKEWPSAPYGLRGNFPVRQLVSWARSMQNKLDLIADRAKLSGC